MKGIYLLAALVVIGSTVRAQDMKNFRAYDTAANAEKDIAALVAKAKAEKKHVFIQGGGNWCIWCARFDDFVKTDPQLDSLMKANFVTYHLNFSKENKNEKTFTKLGFPQRFGFPVFVILDGNGKQIHIQNSSYLEKEKSYNRDVVKGFLMDWGPKALEPAQYKD